MHLIAEVGVTASDIWYVAMTAYNLDRMELGQ